MGRAVARKAFIGCLRPRPAALGATAGAGPDAATPSGLPVHPSARSPPGPAAAPAAARCSASPSPCGAARLGPAPTPRSPRRPPGPPSSAHVTAAGSPQTTLSATAGTHSHAALGAGPSRFRSRPRLRPRRPSSALLKHWRPDGAVQRLLLPGGNTLLSGALSLHPETHVPGSLRALETACKKAMLPGAHQLPVCHQVQGMPTPESVFVPTPLSNDPASVTLLNVHHLHMVTTFLKNILLSLVW